MKTLYFAPHLMCPLNSGARLRDYHLARELAERAEVTFVEMRDSRARRQTGRDDACFAKVVTLDKGRTYSPLRILRGLAGPVPLTVLNCWSATAGASLRELLRNERFDTVQVEGVHLMEYLPVIREAQGHTSIVVDWHNIESELMWRYAQTTSNPFNRVAAKRTAKLLEGAENRLLNECDIHTVPSERERQKLLERHPLSNVQVIPNGVEISRYSPTQMPKAYDQAIGGHLKPTLLFVGLMDYHANIDAVTWFARMAWPEIARKNPSLHFTIVGRDPAPEVRALASDRVHVTGTVDDVRPFYARAAAAVVPLRSGSGTRLKILEAMAARVPVVSTRLGAEGIEAEHDVHILLADSSQDIATAVCRLVRSPETRTKISKAAEALVRRLYDWTAIGERLYGIHEKLVEPQTSNAIQGVL